MTPNPEKERQDALTSIRLIRKNVFSPQGTFLDLGANIGEVSIAALTFGFDRVVAVEAHPSTFKRLVKRTKGYSQIETIHGAVLDVDGKIVNVSSPENSTGAGVQFGTMRKDRPRGYFRLVESIGFAGLVKRTKPSFIKMDIERSEYPALRGFVPPKSLLGILIEFHSPNSVAKFAEQKAIEQAFKKEGFARTYPLAYSLNEEGTATKFQRVTILMQRKTR